MTVQHNCAHRLESASDMYSQGRVIYPGGQNLQPYHRARSVLPIRDRACPRPRFRVRSVPKGSRMVHQTDTDPFLEATTMAARS